MAGGRVIAHHEAAGRLETVRVGARYAEETQPRRTGDGAVESLALAEGELRAGAQRLGPLLLRVAVDAEGDAASFDLVVRNAGERTIHLESVLVGLRWAGPPGEGLRFLRHGWQSWSFVGSRDLDEAGEPPFPSGAWLRGMHHGVGAPPPDRAGWHESDLLSVAGPSRGGAACLAGVLECGRGTGLVYLRGEGGSVRVEAEVRYEVPLAPGAEIEVERVRVALGEDAARLLEEHAALHGERAGARTAAPFQAGWCSWYHYFHDVSEEALLRNLDALAASRAELPIELVQLDDGYQRAVGDWLETNAKFPRGLAPVAAAIRDAGFRAGIWTAPFCVAPESRLFGARREWLLRRGSDFHRALFHPVWAKDGFVYALDASREEVRSHLLRTHAALAGMGFSYQKLDFLYVAAMQADAADPSVSRARRLRLGLEAIRAGAGEEAFLLGCGCPLGPAIGAVDGMRIGPDVAPHWLPVAEPHIAGLEETLPSTRSAIRSVYARAFMHRRLWLNDPDCLMARTRDTKLVPDEVASLAAAIAVTGGITLFSDDVAALAPEDVARVRETLALAREVDAGGARGSARPLGLLAGEIPAGAAARTAAGGIAVLLNAAEEARCVRVDLRELGDPAGLGPAPALRAGGARIEGGALAADLAPHQSAVAKLRGEPRLAVFCDFDGTFARQDVGSTIARTHLPERRAQLWARFERGELRAWDYNLALLDGLRLSEQDLDAFLRTIELDPGAAELVRWCEERGVPFRVLSDGFDRNLDRLQELTGVRFAYDANRLWYEEGAWRIAAGHPDPHCPCGTGTCKRGRIAAFRAAHPTARIVHIGDGRVSDLCAAFAADVVFAKHSLAEELTRRGLSFEPFRDLRDVRDRLEGML
jgi:alpha-galactosidase